MDEAGVALLFHGFDKALRGERVDERGRAFLSGRAIVQRDAGRSLDDAVLRIHAAGNAGDHFAEQRLRFGRFFYRFPNGESGADVYDRWVGGQADGRMGGLAIGCVLEQGAWEGGLCLLMNPHVTRPHFTPVAALPTPLCLPTPCPSHPHPLHPHPLHPPLHPHHIMLLLLQDDAV